MARPISLTLAPTASVANAVCLIQTPVGAGALTINGTLATAGIATLDLPRHLLITTAADDHARTLAITGTDRFGNVMTTTTAAPNATTKIVTGYNFKTITGITIDAASAGAITIGTANSLDSAWLALDWIAATDTTITVTLSSGASLTFAVQSTIDPIQSKTFAESTANTMTTTLLGTASMQATLIDPLRALRLALSAFVSGSATIQILARTR